MNESHDREHGAFVRPFIVSGGRTVSSADLTFDSLVLTAEGAMTTGLDPALTKVLEVCLTTQSVADVAAEMGVPLGVAAILLGDLIDKGLVEQHGTTDWQVGKPVLHRILEGVRAL